MSQKDDKRLIEVAFPLKQASLDSVHEQNVRQGHIKTLHLWPARRPLAACRAALICTLLPDPGDENERKRILERLAGKVVQKVEKKKMPNGRVVESIKEVTEGGILHWGRENGPDLEWFRQEIRKAYDGKPPKVLDPFAGGGSIPLEAMRLGCEATAIDINPVAWFILKCTLEYPQKLAGQTRPLPDFALRDREFMEFFFKAKGLKGAQLEAELDKLGHGAKGNGKQKRLIDNGGSLEADLAWHVRAWGKRVLERAKAELEPLYPLVNGAPPMAYLWARTVQCKNCRAIVPLYKTRWLCRRSNKRVVLTCEPNVDRSGTVFGVQHDVPVVGGNAAQRREHDRRLGAGTMTAAGGECPCCCTIMTMKDIRAESQAGRTSYQLMAVVTESADGKLYHPPDASDLSASSLGWHDVQADLDSLSGCSLGETFAPASTRSISAQLYGVRQWKDLFTPRQIRALAAIGKLVRHVAEEVETHGYGREWRSAVPDYLVLAFDRMLMFMCVNGRWKPDADTMTDAFARNSISLQWDFAEAQPTCESAGSFSLCYERVAAAIEGLLEPGVLGGTPNVFMASADSLSFSDAFDAVITDPPYYHAISYADLSDFFYTWLRGLRRVDGREFGSGLAEKTSEIVQHIRQDKDRQAERAKYERGMADSFRCARQALRETGRLVCAFAHKDPDAWETLVSAMVQAGFVVTASWPVQTELPSRQRAAIAASLASSVWLVCKKRPAEARPGWDNRVLDEMRQNINQRLRDFWDAGIRGPDFVWAATGPALEAYSKHPVVKKANDPGQVMTVPEFLRHVRRIVVDFVVGRVLSGDGEAQTVTGLDDVTTYYLLHRHDFGMDDAPAGPCILYAVSCGLSDGALAGQYDILMRSGGKKARGEDEEEETEAEEESEGSGSAFRLKPWNKRAGQGMGYDPAVDSPKARAAEAQVEFWPDAKEPPRRRVIPLVDQVHRLMHLWKAGDLVKVDEYIELRGLRRSQLFHQLLQALIELAGVGSEERSILENISNHLAARGAAPGIKQVALGRAGDDEQEHER